MLALFAVVGSLVQAQFFGTIILIIARRQALDTKVQENSAAMRSAMKSLGIMPDLQLRIIAYDTYERLHRSPISIGALFSQLSPQLKFELNLYRYTEIFGNTPLFRKSPPTVIRFIVLALKDLIFLPGDYVCRHGEFGDSMYFIAKGECVVLAEDNDTVLATLRAGCYFGEISLLTGGKRTAFVRAQTFCVLAHMTHDDFEPIIKKLKKN